MNYRVATVGFLVIVLAVAVGTGAVTPEDEIGSEESGSVYVMPYDGPNGDGYTEIEDGGIRLVIDRINPQAETVIEELFVVGYDGEGTAEIWIEHGSDAVTFYDTNGLPIENKTETDRILLSNNETEPVGMSVKTGSSGVAVDEVTLIALLPEKDGLEVDIPGGGGTPATEPAPPEPDTPETGDRERLSVDMGELSVSFRQPEFEFTTSVSDTNVGIRAAGIAGQVATVVNERTPDTEEEIVVESTVRNTGTASGTVTAALRLNGRVADRRQLEVGSGQVRNVSFNVGFDEPGRYEVAVGDSEPVTVTVSEVGSGVLPLAAVALLTSMFAVYMTVRRRRQGDE